MLTNSRVLPGRYPGSNQAYLLHNGDQQYLFQNMLIVSGTASIAVQLERINRTFYPFACSLQIWFTDVNGVPANPGTFEIDAQTSDIDADAQYCLAQGLTALNASFAGRIELTLSWCTFLRVYAKTVTNSVYLNVLVTR